MFSAPIPPSLMPPEPYIEINPTSQGQKYHASNNYHGSQFKVTIKNQQNNSQRIRLLQGTFNFYVLQMLLQLLGNEG